MKTALIRKRVPVATQCFSRNRHRCTIAFILLCVTFVSAHSVSADVAWHLRWEEQARPANLPAFVYDPLTGRSQQNAGVHVVPKDGKQGQIVKTNLTPKQSFTIEAFACLSAAPNLKPREVMPVFASTPAREQLLACIRRNPPPHSYHWWQCRLITQGKQPLDLTRNRYRGLTMARKSPRIRHVAFTWNAQTRVAACYVDYQLLQRIALENTPLWDLSQITIGTLEGPKQQPFDGWIDELRITRGVLPAWHFLRFSTVELNDVSFQPETNPALPADYGHVDVRLHYGAIGDGRHDDTSAIQRAFADNENRVPNEYQTVYFPAGTYLISDTVRFSRFMVVRGAGRNATRIQLQNKASGYQNPKIPKAAFAVGYDWPTVGRTRKMRAGNVIGNYLFDFSIHTGQDNPAALGLDFHCNNIGCVENIRITSGDGQGLVGLDLQRPWPGPCLIKNVEIDGFEYGIAAAHREYSLVFSHLKLWNQSKAALLNNGNSLSIERFLSVNRVPAIINRNGGLVVLLSSQLTSGDPQTTAIQSNNASLYLRNIDIEGYGQSVEETRQKKDQAAEVTRVISDQKILEYSTGPFCESFPNKQQGSLKLDIQATPEFSRPTTRQWVNVQNFQQLVSDGDWAPAIQAAIDSGHPVVYFPSGPKYTIRTNVYIRGKARMFFGAHPKMVITNSREKLADDQHSQSPAFVLDKNLPEFHCEFLSLPHIRHAGPTDLILRHCQCEHISAEENCGRLFIEDASGKWRFNQHQRVWARQLNPETKGIPEIINHGGTLWILGLKTEYLSTKLVNRNGARTELLGGLMYPVHPVNDETLPMFINENSDVSLIHAVSVYKKNHKIYMKDTQGTETRDYRNWHWTAGRPLMNLYRSSRR